MIKIISTYVKASITFELFFYIYILPTVTLVALIEITFASVYVQPVMKALL